MRTAIAPLSLTSTRMYLASPYLKSQAASSPGRLGGRLVIRFGRRAGRRRQRLWRWLLQLGLRRRRYYRVRVGLEAANGRVHRAVVT